MKFTDLSPAKQQLLKAFTEGETIQYYTPTSGWKDTDMITFFGAVEFCHPDWLRVKVKEPVVTYLYSGVGIHGNIYIGEYRTPQEVMQSVHNAKFYSFIKRTFHDSKLVNVQIVQE